MESPFLQEIGADGLQSQPVTSQTLRSDYYLKSYRVTQASSAKRYGRKMNDRAMIKDPVILP